MMGILEMMETVDMMMFVPPFLSYILTVMTLATLRGT